MQRMADSVISEYGAEDRPSHVVVASPNCAEEGSVGTAATKQASELAKSFKVTLISGTLPIRDPGGIRMESVSFKSFRFLHRFSHVPAELSLARAVRRKLLRLHSLEPVDFVLFHGHVLGAVWAKRFFKYQPIPFGIVVHGNIFNRPLGTYDPRVTLLYEIAARRAYAKANLVIVLSQAMFESLQSKGVKPEIMRVIPNGVDPTDLDIDLNRHVPVSCKNSCIKLLYVGPLSRIKGVDILLRACAELKDRSVNFHLTVAGDGQQRADLENLSRQFGITDQVHFAGRIPRKNLGSFYRSADLVCVPSRSDSLPTVVMEAMIAGRPVAGAKVEGIPTMVHHLEDGILFAPEDAKDLASQIEYVAMRPELLRKLGQQAWIEAKDRFSWERSGEMLREAVRAAVKSGGGNSR